MRRSLRSIITEPMVVLMFTFTMLAAQAALAQRQTQKEAFAENPSALGNATTTCDVTFATGTDVNATQFCVTANGNITQFSIDNQEMIAFERIGEGYAICDATGSRSYYDYAYEDSGNWQVTKAFSHNGNVVTITRLTIDGIWSLKQTITNVPATNTSPAAAKVSMALTNHSGQQREVILWRYADIDADSDDDGNDFDFTYETAFGLEPGFHRGLSLTNNTSSVTTTDQNVYAQNTSAGPDPCTTYGSTVANQPFQGDGSVVAFWSFTANPGKTTTFVSTYKPI